MGSGTDLIPPRGAVCACAYHGAMATNGQQLSLEVRTLLKLRLAFPPAYDANATDCPICEVGIDQVSACRLSFAGNVDKTIISRLCHDPRR